MSKEFLTIITPVYNRAELIKNLYDSLKDQTNKNFIWLVVDDGSSDAIQDVMQEFEKETDFPIEFYHKPNGGKHTALNLAFSNLHTELVMIVDSDDTLVPNATDIIEKNWENCKEKDIAGCVFLKGYDQKNCVGKSELKNGIYDMIDAMFSHDIGGDKAEVFRCDIISRYRFPEFPDERFLGEDTIWRQIYLKYRMMYVNEIIYLCEYLEGGLTKQGRRLRINCPLGGMENSKVSFDSRFPLKERIKRAWLFVCYGKFAHLNFREIRDRSGAKTLVAWNYLPGLFLYFCWKKKYLG
jgi:glycosyltransferase involved in cell wall biosynthesis